MCVSTGEEGGCVWHCVQTYMCVYSGYRACRAAFSYPALPPVECDGQGLPHKVPLQRGGVMRVRHFADLHLYWMWGGLFRSGPLEHPQTAISVVLVSDDDDAVHSGGLGMQEDIYACGAHTHL